MNVRNFGFMLDLGLFYDDNVKFERILKYFEKRINFISIDYFFLHFINFIMFITFIDLIDLLLFVFTHSRA